MSDTGSDYRSARMPSAEGHGHARQRLAELFARKLEPEESDEDTAEEWPEELLEGQDPEWFERAITPYARRKVPGFTTELVGFWVLWQAEGGFEGLQRLGMSETTIWRRVRAFRDAFGAHPDDFALPGVTVDLENYWFDPAGMGYLAGRRAPNPD